MNRLWPIPRTGRRTHDAMPLAGHGQVWFDHVMRDGDEMTATRLDPDLLAPFLAARAPIAGLPLDRTRIMGILNLTPDSFSDGGRLAGPGTALARARTMAEEADILDIGGESTRPGAEEVPVEEEIARTAPVIAAIREAGIAVPISIDTRKAEVARAALQAGADIVNDVSGLTHDPDLAGVVAEAGAALVLMHMRGTPQTMQDAPRYDDVEAEVYDHLAARIEAAEAAGIPRTRLVVDPGIGFGKKLQHNLTLLSALGTYHGLGTALMVGASRKRFIGTIGGADVPADRLGGSIAVALHAAAQAVQIVRVHDTYETRQALRLFEALNGPEGASDPE